MSTRVEKRSGFQFLGIPPKGELIEVRNDLVTLKRFQFLGIPPKGEPVAADGSSGSDHRGFQFLGIPPKGERR